MLLWEGRVVSWQGGDRNNDDNFGFDDGDHRTNNDVVDDGDDDDNNDDHTNDDKNYDNDNDNYDDDNYDDDDNDNHAYAQAAQLRAARTDWVESETEEKVRLPISYLVR